MKTRKTEKLLDGIEASTWRLRQKMLWKADQKWFIARDKAPSRRRRAKMDAMESGSSQGECDRCSVKCGAIERDFFYDPHYHASIWPLAEPVYAPVSLTASPAG